MKCLLLPPKRAKLKRSQFTWFTEYPLFELKLIVVRPTQMMGLIHQMNCDEMLLRFGLGALE